MATLSDGAAWMIALPPRIGFRLAAGATDTRKGSNGLAMLVQQQLGKDSFGSQPFVFHKRRSHLIKNLWWDAQGLVLYTNVLTACGPSGRRPSMAWWR